MYYSKSYAKVGGGVNIPSNYHGTAFQAPENTGDTYTENANQESVFSPLERNYANSERDSPTRENEAEGGLECSLERCERAPESSLISSFFQSVSLEDVLLLGLLLVIHDESPNDPVLILLLILLLTK